MGHAKSDHQDKPEHKKPRKHRMTKEERKVIIASSVGTVFEWYDFYLYGSLAAIISKQFFSGVNPNAGFIFALLAFAAGFAVRPFGALVFGRLGDIAGRKYTFLITMTIMGLCTFLVGLLPSYASIGFISPVILITLRLLQGLALGGEYGGAVTYVAEYAPQHRRGFFTSWIQITATLGLFLSLLVILSVRTIIGEDAFADWGWRIPFLLSAILLIISVWIRLQMEESPAFKRIKSAGKLSASPLTDSFAKWSNAKYVLLALFGLTAGQGVVWYTGQFYALFFLTQTLKISGATANILIMFSLIIATPFFIFFGSLSDKIGRKPIIMAGCLLAVLTYFPLFSMLTEYGNPALAQALAKSPVVVSVDSKACSFQFNPVGVARFTKSCDIAKNFLTQNSVNYTNVDAPAGSIASIKIGDKVINSFEGTGLSTEEFKAKSDAFTAALKQGIKEAGYPEKADPAAINKPMVVLILVILVLYVTMVYGPIAAMLVELFPTRIRYTSMSLPYHIGNGWFGGFLPATAFAMVAASGNIYYGLWYPISVAAMTFVIGMIFIKETKNTNIFKEEEGK
jgi:MFS family permease